MSTPWVPDDHSPEDHPIVRFRRAVDAALGDRVERVVLFGSRARGDAAPDSDWDLAIYLRAGTDSAAARRALSALTAAGTPGADIQTVLLTPDERHRSLELRRAIREQGVEVTPRGLAPQPEPEGPVPPIDDEVREILERARQHLEEADAVDERRAPGAVVHSTYYAMFQAARALLLKTQGTASTKHGAVGSAIEKLVTQLDPAAAPLAGAVTAAYALRVASDYTGERPDAATAAALRERAHAFVAFCEGRAGAAPLSGSS